MNNLNIKIDKNNFKIRTMQDHDWQKVRQIYLEGIATQNATFETTAPEHWEEWDKNHLSSCRLVAEHHGEVLGWAMLSAVSNRRVFAGVAEVSIYVSEIVQRKGIGYALLSTLIIESEKNHIWTLQAGVFPENLASLAVHKKCGFRVVGIREKIGQLHGQWRDMMLLERRSLHK